MKFKNLWKPFAVLTFLLLAGLFVFDGVQVANAHSVRSQSNIIISGSRTYWKVRAVGTSGDWGGEPSWNLVIFNNNNSGNGRYYFSHPDGTQPAHTVSGKITAKEGRSPKATYVQIFVQESDYSWAYAGTCSLKSYWRSCNYSASVSDARGLILRSNGDFDLKYATMDIR